jgi:hypothetical protein
MEIKTLMQALHQRPIAYYPIYRTITGSTTAGILLSQVLFWHSGFGKKFHKTDDEVIEVTHLSPKELRGAKALLKGLDFVSITAEGVPARTHYDIDYELLLAAVQKGQTSLAQRAKLCGPKGLNCVGQKGQTYITKTTTKTTTKKTLSKAGEEKIENPNPEGLPQIELDIRAAVAKIEAYLIQWPAMEQRIREALKQPKAKREEILERAEEWVRYNSANTAILYTPEKELHKGFVFWCKRQNSFSQPKQPRGGNSAPNQPTTYEAPEKVAQTAKKGGISEEQQRRVDAMLKSLGK